MEATGAGVLLLLVALAWVGFASPSSPLSLRDRLLVRLVVGLATCAALVAIVYSPLGRRSGAHLNPAVTLTFLRLGKVRPWDAVFYVLAQLAGAAAGIAAAAAIVGASFRNPPVHGIVTVPGPRGTVVALAAEILIAFVLMTAVLEAASHAALAHLSGLFAGLLIALFVVVEQPLSGASANPARTIAAAASSGDWHALWLYVVATPLGMLAAAELHVRTRRPRVPCAKLNDDHRRCIFACDRHGGRPTH